MKTVVLDGGVITCMEDVHTAFADALELPDYYGRNLDALYDCLTDLAEPAEVQLCDLDGLEAALGKRFDSLLLVLADAVDAGKVELSIAAYDEDVYSEE